MKRILSVLSTVFLLTIISRFMGFFREIIIGNYVGANSFADEVTFLFTIPLYIQMIVGGAFTTAYISVGLKKDEKWEKTVYENTLKIAGVFSTMIVITLIFTYDNAFKSVEYFLSGALSFSTIYLYNKTSLISGKYNIQKKYVLPLLSVTYGNILGIFLIVIFNNLFENVSLIMYSISFFLSALSSYFYLKFKNHEKNYNLKINKSIIKNIIFVAFPIIIGGAIPQIINLIQRAQLVIFHSSVDEGSLSLFNYASKIINFPQGIIVTLIATILFPKIVVKAKESISVFKSSYFKFEKIVFVLSVLLSFGIFLSANLIVKILFGFGNFDSKSLIEIKSLLKILCFTNIPLILTVFITRFFYAIEKSYKSVSISFFNIVVLNFVLFLILVNFYEEVVTSIIISSYISLISNYFFLRNSFKKV